MHREPLTLQAGQALLLLSRGRLLNGRGGVVVLEISDPCRWCSPASFRSPSASKGTSKHFLLGGGGGVGIQDGSLSDKSLCPCWRCACGGGRRRGKGVLQGREVERLIRATGLLEELLRGCSIAGIGRRGSERVLPTGQGQVSHQGLCKRAAHATPGDEPVPMDRLANRQSGPAG